MLKYCSYTCTTTQTHKKLTTASVPTHKTVHNNVYPNHRDPKCFMVYFECLSVPFFVPFREDYHQSEDGFSTLILTNKIASGKSETGDDDTAVQCLKFLVHKQHVY